MKKIKIETVKVPVQVAELLKYAESSDWYPFDMKKDIRFFNLLWLHFGRKVGLFELFLKFEIWQIDNEIKNCRLAFRNFCKKAHEWKTTPQKPKPPSSPNRKPTKANPLNLKKLIKPVVEPVSPVRRADKKNGTKINPVYTQKLTQEQLTQNRKKNIETAKRLKAKAKQDE